MSLLDDIAGRTARTFVGKKLGNGPIAAENVGAYVVSHSGESLESLATWADDCVMGYDIETLRVRSRARPGADGNLRTLVRSAGSRAGRSGSWEERAAMAAGSFAI